MKSHHWRHLGGFPRAPAHPPWPATCRLPCGGEDNIYRLDVKEFAQLKTAGILKSGEFDTKLFQVAITLDVLKGP